MSFRGSRIAPAHRENALIRISIAILSGAALLLGGPLGAGAQTAAPSSTATPAQAPRCVMQYEAAAEHSPASLVKAGYTIVGAVTGGIWLQKDRDVLYCNSGRVPEGEVLCWKLREPLKGQPCQ